MRALFPLFFAVACSNGAVPAPDQGAPIQAGEATGSLPCGSRVEFDFWSVETQGVDRLRMLVDTIDPATTFDPGFCLHIPESDDWEPTTDSMDLGYQTFCEFGDYAGFDCTYAPSAGICPQVLWDLQEEGSPERVILLVSGERGSCAGPDAEYRIRTEHDGQPAALTYIGRAHIDDLGW